MRRVGGVLKKFTKKGGRGDRRRLWSGKGGRMRRVGGVLKKFTKQGGCRRHGGVLGETVVHPRVAGGHYNDEQ